MRLVKCPRCGNVPEGTLDTIPGVALVIEREEDSKLEWYGETRVCWDGQETEKDSYGLTYFWCGDCDRRFAVDISDDDDGNSESDGGEDDEDEDEESEEDEGEEETNEPRDVHNLTFEELRTVARTVVQNLAAEPRDGGEFVRVMASLMSDLRVDVDPLGSRPDRVEA